MPGETASTGGLGFGKRSLNVTSWQLHLKSPTWWECPHGVDMNISIRSSDLTELASKPELIPQAGTATLVSGTGTFIAPISMLREIAGAPDAVQQLEDIVEALAEQEQLYAMAILGAAVAGVANTLWYIPG